MDEPNPINLNNFIIKKIIYSYIKIAGCSIPSN